MSAIREELTLIDKFSQTFSQYLRMGRFGGHRRPLAHPQILGKGLREFVYQRQFFPNGRHALTPLSALAWN